MKEPAAKEEDHVIATDTHSVNGTPTPLPFDGQLTEELSPNVFVERKHAATIGSKAKNDPVHEAPAGKSFDKKPTNMGVVVSGSGTVFMNWKKAARNNDSASTCNDPKDLPVGKIVAKSTVVIGD